MNATDETIRHESAALYRFVDSIVSLCSGFTDYPVYTKSSLRLFNYIITLGNETKAFLSHFPSDAAKTPALAQSKRQKLVLLRAGWETLHEYLKPALDADTLHLPIPLVLAFQDRINKVEELERIEFTVFHTNKLNYLEVPPDIARDRANQIADLVGGTHFLQFMGLVGIPYSQSNGFFLNSLLPHEMAHFAYQEVFSVDADTEIDRVLERMERDVGALDNLDISFCRTTLERWVEEIFCDLFSICLIGPAYSFALIELTGATVLSGTSGSDASEFHLFVQDHPAEIARFAAQYRLLKKLGWWNEIKDFNCAAAEVLRISEDGNDQLSIQLSLPIGVTEKRFLQCYHEMCNWLLRYVPLHIRTRKADISHFHDQSSIVCDYLREAIVPSTILVDGKLIHPSPVVLINSAFRFYLEHLPELISNIDRENRLSVESRSRYSERVELWTLKAIEDYRLFYPTVTSDASHT